MKRPLILIIIGLMLGINASTMFLNIIYNILFLGLILFCGFFILKKMEIKIEYKILFILFSIFGFIYSYFLLEINLNKFVEFDRKMVEVEGYINSEPDIKLKTTLYEIKVLTIKDSITKLKYKVDGKVILSVDDFLTYNYGEKILFNGTLSIPKGQRNPYGFNYRNYLSKKGISASVFCKKDEVKILESEKLSLINYGIKTRKMMLKIIKEMFPKQQGALLSGILIGYTNDLSDYIEEKFRDAGLSHIMAVSGANVAFLVFPILFVFKKFKVNERIASIISILAVLFFVLITGFSPSVLRAAIMAIIVLLSKIIYRQTDFYNSISLAAFILILYNPFIISDIGFMLSFAATISVVELSKPISGLLTKIKYLPNWINEVVSVTLAAQIGVLPISIYYFNKVSLIAIISNLLVVPLTGITTVAGFIVVIVGAININIGIILSYPLTTILSFILFITKLSADIPYSTITMVTPFFFTIFIYYTIIILIKNEKKINKVQNIKVLKYFLIAFFIILLAMRFIPYSGLQIVFLDVGSGDSSLVRLDDKVILIDGGGKANDENEKNTGKSIIVPFLLDWNIDKIDLIVATHAHADHVNGLIAVLNTIKVNKILIPNYKNVEEESGFKNLLSISKTKKIVVEKGELGDSISFNTDSKFEILNPISTDIFDSDKLNNSSLVLKLIYKKINILFAGDIESDKEKEMIDKVSKYDIDVLKVSHHASNTSTTEEFLDFFNPKIAIISSDSKKNSNVGLSKKVLDRLVKRNIKILRTDEKGAIILNSDGNQISSEYVVN